MARTSQVNGELWGARARDWAALQEGQVVPLYETVLDAVGVGPGTRLLDAGCGAGLVAQMAAARGATVTGVDASPSMLDVARERVPDATFEVADLESLPFDDATFDAVTGFNSFQYAGDPVAALREAKRVARSGAPVAVVTWAPPENMPAAAVIAALRPVMPAPPPGAPGPFALSDETALRELVSTAGLAPERVGDVETMWTYADMDTAVRALNASGVAQRAIRHSGEEAVTRAHREVLETFRRPDGSVAVLAAFRYLIARA